MSPAEAHVAALAGTRTGTVADVPADLFTRSRPTIADWTLDTILADTWTLDALTELALRTWSILRGEPGPERRGDWIAAFRLAGTGRPFCGNEFRDRRCPHPPLIRLWRGTPGDHVDAALSWTVNQSQARIDAAYYLTQPDAARGAGDLCDVTVNAADLIAHLPGYPHPYLVDTTGLRVTRAPVWTRPRA